ncbi:ceramide glucosyltransferase [Sphingobium lactosutens DS20]|uniref:Ceramide glucosyltransferase n=2 Tax=Sphingobium TaxID=165695 RepID=T0HV21_9SPHN|nr:ceramide glucosyltransferase [Sphingobium lactosutens DS20]
MLTLIGVATYWRHLPTERKEEAPEGVAVVLSLRDDWDGSPNLIARLKAQHVRFRLILATSGDCPAARDLAAREGDWVQFIAAGTAQDEGQKVHKLRAALRDLRPEDRCLVFLDADIVPPARLLGRLLFPLARDKADIVTGYRLLLPGRGWMSGLVGAVEMQLATLPRSATATMPWGGAMAMTRAVADRLDLDAVLAGRLSDDMSIGLAGWRAKLRMRPVRDLLVASPIEGRAADLLAFGVRQYRHVRTNSLRMWGIATGVVAAQSAAWLWAIGWGSWTAIAIGYGAGWGRALIRRKIATSVLEPGQAKVVQRSLYWDMVTPFAVTWAHLAVQLAAAMSNDIRWGGWLYRVKRGRVTSMCRLPADI